MSTCNRGGQSKGTAAKNKDENTQNYKDTLSSCTEQYQAYYINSRDNRSSSLGKRQAKIDEEKQKYGVSDKISFESIWSRLKQNNLDVTHPGTCSPMEDVGDSIVAIAVQKGKMNEPLTCKEDSMLANNLIKGTSIERKVIS